MSQTIAAPAASASAQTGRRISAESVVAVVAALALVAGAMFATAFPFTSDGAIHAEMARAMGLHGSLAIAGDGGVAGAPPLLTISAHVRDGAVYAQYPAGYGVIAGPFYALGGLRGLVVLNALAAAFALFATWRIAHRCFDRETALAAVVLLGGATFFHNYAFAIWPHMASLALLLGAAWAAAVAADARPGRMRLGGAALAGLIAGLGVTIRADLILVAPAIFLWMRLFAMPDARAPAAIFLAALAPGLVLAASFNLQKFGVLAPLYYGAKSTPDGVARYLWLLPVIAGAGGLTLAVNVRASCEAVKARIGAQRLWLAGGLAGVVALTLAYERITEFLYSVFVLTIDLQGYNGDYVQPGVEHNEYGHLLFWGFPKRALMQSLPFAPLISLPIVWFFRGAQLPAVSLCLLFIAAPIAFYSLNQWHGGGAYNMRYFLGAVPFIAILAAAALTAIAKRASLERQWLLAAIVAGAATYVGANEISQSTPALFAPMALYPQLAVAAVVLAAVAAFAWRPAARTANAALAVSLVAISYGGMINLADFSAHEKAKAEQAALSRIIASATQPGSLILTPLPVLMPDAIARGVSVHFVDGTTAVSAAAALTAFTDAGRCVYLHNSLARDLIAPALGVDAPIAGPVFLAAKRFPAEARLEFYMPARQAPRCALTGDDLK